MTTLIRVVGTGPYGPVEITVGDVQILCRINPTSERRRYRCSACGPVRSANACEHIRLAAIARVLADDTPTTNRRSESA